MCVSRTNSSLYPIFSTFKDKPAQLIFYDRPDVEGPKLSDYHITTVENPDDLKVSLIEVYVKFIESQPFCVSYWTLGGYIYLFLGNTDTCIRY